jgi:hypothetical protein
MITSETQIELTAEQIAENRTNALNAEHPASWVWDESVVSFVPPIPLPTDGKPYLWDEASKSFIPFPGFPTE